ncbi:MAG: hypothetical protein IPJ39_00980 [Saprospiraceae bacterium]|nr:hypothetical protein [Saprospiraceae bacterium]MBK8886624.1 hypothetical protein [Saprospiraceae bacterium]
MTKYWKSKLVCHIKKEKQHKVFKGIAQKSKSIMGWVYGFKNSPDNKC